MARRGMAWNSTAAADGRRRFGRATTWETWRGRGTRRAFIPEKKEGERKGRGAASSSSLSSSQAAPSPSFKVRRSWQRFLQGFSLGRRIPASEPAWRPSGCRQADWPRRRTDADHPTTSSTSFHTGHSRASGMGSVAVVHWLARYTCPRRHRRRRRCRCRSRPDDFSGTNRRSADVRLVDVVVVAAVVDVASKLLHVLLEGINPASPHHHRTDGRTDGRMNERSRGIT